MAIYHYHRTIGKREEGKNSVFAAAYIRREERTCIKTGESVNFSQKEDLIYAECFLPEDAPFWATNLRHSKIQDASGKFIYDENGFNFSDYAWNQIEFIENRKNSQLYFHDDIAIPIELSKEAAIELARDFAKEVIAVNGYFCDVSIHWEPHNPHFHILRPLRQLTQEGFSKNKPRFTREEFSKSVFDLRESWANYANQKLMEYGIEARIDHRSYQARGIDLQPTLKIGKATHMMGSKHQEIRVAKNQVIRARNFENIKNDPGILAKKIAQEQLAFTEKDVQEEIKKYLVNDQILESLKSEQDASQKKLVEDVIEILKKKHAIFSERQLKEEVLKQAESAHSFNDIFDQVKKSPELLELGLGDDGRIHFTTQAAFALENDVIERAETLHKQHHFLISDQHFNEVVKRYGLNSSQKIALKHITNSGDLRLVTGLAGTGKTYMLGAAKEIWERSGYKIHGVAFSGRASAGLENDSKIKSYTNAKFTALVRKKYIKLTSRDIVVMDEMGMTSLDDMQSILGIIHGAGAKFVGVGDIEQTQPVGRGAPMRAMVQTVGAVVMDKIIRQKVDWHREATLAMETQRTIDGLDLYYKNGNIEFSKNLQEAKSQLIDQWHKQLIDDQRNDRMKEYVLIAHKNETVQALNVLAREKLVSDGVLKESIIIKVAEGDLPIAVGERLLFGFNDHKLGLKNNDFGLLLNIEGDQLTVRLDSGKELTFSLKEYRHIEHGYAATVHNIQGFTGDYAFKLIDSRGWDRHLTLVGASRHRYDLRIVADLETFKDYRDMAQVLCREGLKDTILDYPVGFSIRRGFKANNVATRAVNFIRNSTSKVSDAWLYLVNYQGYLEKQNTTQALNAKEESIQQRRQDAQIVAEFSDKRIFIAERMAEIQKLVGDQSKSIDEILSVAQDEREDTIKEKNLEKEAIKAELLQEVYNTQLLNSRIAKQIHQNYSKYELAIQRNRISYEAIEKSVSFGEKHDEIAAVFSAYQLRQFYNPIKADEIYSEIKSYYGHIVSMVLKQEERKKFIANIRNMAMQHRYDLAFEVFGVERRQDIHTVKRYLDLDYQVSSDLYELKNHPETIHVGEIKKRLHDVSVDRNKLAHKILLEKANYESLLTHFGIDKERIEQHQSRYLDRELVRNFCALSSSTSTQQNYRKQVLAHRIKQEPKRYSIYIDDFLADGWRSINLENWHYQRSIEIHYSSRQFKESIALVKKYHEASALARDAWQAAIKRRSENVNSKNYLSFVKRAQGLSYQRDKIASELMRDIEDHSGALAYDKVNLEKLYARARHVDLIEKYRKDKNEIRKTYMANYISANLKNYGHGVAVYGLYAEIKEKAQHYRYLRLIKESPDLRISQAIRWGEQYQQKRVEAAQAWAHYKNFVKKHGSNRYLENVAKHVAHQRNKAAYDFIMGCASYGLIEPEIKGIDIDYAQLRKACDQHIGYERIIAYLNATDHQRGLLAHELLKNKASYHFIYEQGIDFKTLRKESNVWLQSKALVISAVQPDSLKVTEREIKRWDYDVISHALVANAAETYRAIFGEPKKVSGHRMRFEGAIEVTLTGSHAGSWYSFKESGKGGGPIQAIQERLGLSFKDALQYGASLAGLTESQATVTELVHSINAVSEKQVSAEEKKVQIVQLEQNHRIESAQSIWEGTDHIRGSLAERYFSEHRHINDFDRMEIRYWPEGRGWIDYDDQGKRIEKINKIPAAVIVAKDKDGRVTGLQRIYLDPITAGKNSYMDDPKLSKGITKGSAGVIQVGESGGKLYIAEGPETAASLAMIDAKATVLTSFSVNNLGNLADVIKSYEPGEVILAADNDGFASRTKITTEEAIQKLRSEGVPIRAIYPNNMPGKEKVDWNDILANYGEETLKLQLEYFTARPIIATPAEHYLRVEKNLVGVDLYEARYHPSMRLPDSEKTQHAILLPAVNKHGVMQAMQILYLDDAGQTVTRTAVKGNAKDCAIIVQKGDDLSTVYVSDNFVDAKSIALGDSNVNIFISLDHYQGLENIRWTVDQLSRKPGAIAVVTDNFEKNTERTLYKQTKPLRMDGVEILMARGRLNGDYTHVSVNEAMQHEKRVRGDNYIQRMAIKAPIEEKLSIKDKLTRAVKGEKFQSTDQGQDTLIKIPPVVQKEDYFMPLSNEQKEALQSYFVAVNALQKKNDFEQSLGVAEKANRVYQSFRNELSKIVKHPQSIQGARSDLPVDEIYALTSQAGRIGLVELTSILKEVGTVKLDKQTLEQMVKLAEMQKSIKKEEGYLQLAKEFIHKKQKLLTLLSEQKTLSGEGESLKKMSNVDQILSQRFDRGDVIRFGKTLTSVIQENSIKQARSLERKQEKDRGGRER